MSLIRTRLSVMMFLEFFIWGAWLPLFFAYLPERGFSSLQQSLILNTFAIASFVGMFFSNQFADRNFAAERFLAVSHLIGGLAFLGLLWASDFWTFFFLMLVHCLFYVPTISITNSIAFANVPDAKRDFGLVRLWGTIGWIAAAWPYTVFPDRTNIFYFTGASSLLLAAFSLALPHTPPRPAASGESSLAWLESAKFLRFPFIAVLYVVTFIDAMVHQCYFIWTETFLQNIGVAKNYTGMVMSLGQVAEIGTMAVLGFVLKRLGWRTTMILGILGHTVRFAVFALLPYQAPVIASNLLHGICYAFFFATVYIFVDEFFPKDARSSAQGLFNFLILGLGPFVGNFLWPQVGEMAKAVDVTAAVVSEAGQEELAIRGAFKDPRVKPLSLIPLSVTEPGKEPYTRDVNISGEGKFETIITPVAKGTYSIAVELPAGDGRAKERVALPDLVVGDLQPGKYPSVQARRIDFRRLFLWPSGIALVAAVLLLVGFRPPAQAASEGGPGALPH